MWVFTEKFGKVSCIAKGAKRGKSKFLSTTLPFCFGDFVLFKGKSFYNISEIEVLDSFQSLLMDLETITYASYFCELLDICLMDEESNRQLFREVISAFYLLKSKAVDIEVLTRALELNVLRATGYGLNLEECCICKAKLPSSNYVSFQYLGGVCDNCDKINGTIISRAAYNSMKILNKFPLEKLARISLNDKIKNEIFNLVTTIISQNYYRKPKSLETLNFLKGSELNE
ncbi:MAG: recO [Clostridiaceae bacterium]|nr:recO [Clostridiaceae bacterium]